MLIVSSSHFDHPEQILPASSKWHLQGVMVDHVARHYSENLELADVITQSLRNAGKDLNKLTTTNLAMVDEFHIRGRKATLELAAKMNLNADSRVLDIGSGLGGPARTLAETYGCRVTGIDLTQDVATAMSIGSGWANLRHSSKGTPRACPSIARHSMRR